ncbi:MAG TPA: M56 family metallopeptidase [Candidatus Sulfotelmatobacter sp.]|nr:M56 family metallopeptidase [Candidatus Sulfotelmatobacter sp.]
MPGLYWIPVLIECGLRATLPVGIAWAATSLASRSSAATRHFIWASAIVIAVLLPLTTIVMPRWTVATPAPLARLASATRLETIPSPVPSIAAAERTGVGTAAKPENPRQSGLRPWTIVTWIWIMGAAAVFCYALMGHFAARRLYRKTGKVEHWWVQHAEQLAREAGLSSRLRVVESAAVSAPLVLHLWRPIIVIPESAVHWSRSRIRAVLLHEFAHIKRNDFHIQSLAQFACAVYWFNPLVWFAAQQLRLERERACDDFVLLSGTSGADYATDLLEIACGISAPTIAHFAIGLAGHRSQLEQRIVAIVNPRTPRQMTNVLGRFMVALPMLLVAIAAGAVQIQARAIRVPIGQIKIPAPAIQVRSPEFLTGGKEAKMRSGAMESSAARNSQPEEFQWAERMHEHQTIEVHLGRGSIKVLPSTDDTVRVEARTENPQRNQIKIVSASSGVKFCNVVTTARESRNYCEPDPRTSPIEEGQPATEFVIYVPASLHFSGSTVLGDITAERPSADTDMATIKGSITVELHAEQGANFDGNLIDGEVDSDFPLSENTPSLPTGDRPATNAPRIVHATVGSGGPRLSAMVVNGNIRLLRRPAE